MTAFFLGGSVLCATNTVVRTFFGQAILGSFCSPETQHSQKNNSFPFFSSKNLKINDAKVVVLLELIGIINET